MNKKFIKKNIFMIIFMLMSLVAVIALLIMVYFEHNSMKEYDTKKKELLGKIKKLVKQQYTPSTVNVTRIKKDIEGYNEEVRKIQKKFGQPYDLALKAFAEKVGIKLKDFKAKFGVYWEAEKGKATRDLIYLRYKVRQFNEDFPKHRSTWKQAMDAFMMEAQKVTLEKIDVKNVDGIFLAAMGKGRRFSDSPKSCLKFMIDMRDVLTGYFDNRKVEYTTEASEFSFRRAQEPLAGDIERIARAWEIVADLGKRIAEAKVNPKKDALELVSFVKRGLDGEKDGDYTMYRFTFKVNADLNTIRRIVDTLYAAYKDNRVYAIRDIKLTKMVDSVDDILTESERIKEDLDNDTGDRGTRDERARGVRNELNPAGLAPGTDRRRFGSPVNPVRETNPRRTTRRRPARRDINKPLGPKDRGYAELIVGKNNICSAEFEVDYIVFNNSQNN